MVRLRKELRVRYRVRPTAQRETTRTKHRTATLQPRRTRKLVMYAERSRRPGPSILLLPALQRCGTVQYDRVHRNTSPSQANQPASQPTHPDRPGHSRNDEILKTSPQHKARSGRRRINWGSSAPVESSPAHPPQASPVRPVCLPKIQGSAEV